MGTGDSALRGDNTLGSRVCLEAAVPGSPDFTQTAGKPIRCAGWVALKACPSWSPRNVTLREDLVIAVPGAHQVRVRMYAAGINPADVQRTSMLVPPAQKKSSSEATAARCSRHPPCTFPFPYICGLEGAGVIESMGTPGERGLFPGDRVMFLADLTQVSGGTFCQYVLVDSDIVCKFEAASSNGDRELDFVEAATLPVAAQAAYVALFDKMRVEKGRTIFISGASGGVGSVAVQLAHHFGLRVFASCSTRNLKYVESLGADVALDYTCMNVVDEILKETNSYGVDYVLELTSATLAEKHADAIRFGGSICVLTGLLTPFSDLIFRRQLSVHYVFLGMFHQHPVARQQLPLLGAWVQRLFRTGAFALGVEEVTFSRANTALDVVVQGHTRGKMVLTTFHPEEAGAERQRRQKVLGSVEAAG